MHPPHLFEPVIDTYLSILLCAVCMLYGVPHNMKIKCPENLFTHYYEYILLYVRACSEKSPCTYFGKTIFHAAGRCIFWRCVDSIDVFSLTINAQIKYIPGIQFV